MSSVPIADQNYDNTRYKDLTYHFSYQNIIYENEKMENKIAQPTGNWIFTHKTPNGQKKTTTTNCVLAFF